VDVFSSDIFLIFTIEFFSGVFACYSLQFLHNLWQT